MTQNSQMEPELKCYDTSAQKWLTQQVSGDCTVGWHTIISEVLMPYLTSNTKICQFNDPSVYLLIVIMP